MERYITEVYTAYKTSKLTVRASGEVALKLSEKTPELHAIQRSIACMVAGDMPQYDKTMRGRFDVNGITLYSGTHGNRTEYSFRADLRGEDAPCF